MTKRYDSQIDLLRACATRFPPSGFSDTMSFLERLYEGVKEISGKYSYRQYSEDLGFSRTNVLHLFVKGKRPISSASAMRLADSLLLRSGERRYFELLASIGRTKETKVVNSLMVEADEVRKRLLLSKIDHSKFLYYSEWYHVVVRELISLPDFQPIFD